MRVGDTQDVTASIDTSDAWNRVRGVTTPDDAYELDTSVATAAVRGTAKCFEKPNTCTFSVIDGEVLLTPNTGGPVTLGGQSVRIWVGDPSESR